MAFSTDIEKAQSVPPLHISKIAESLGLPEESIEVFGRFKAKIDFTKLEGGGSGRRGKLILVTAMTPTPAGEGKTTVTVGTGDALKRLGKRAVIALREPSLGPVFGMKGGAAGGGYSQVIPMEDINLHFTGDFHAIGAANNLLAAMLDNHIFHGNSLNIDPRQVLWRRCVDMNDRQLRNITDGLGGKGNGVPREDGFDITVASEIMAVLCLSEDLSDLKARLSRIIVAYSFDGRPITAGDLKAQGAMTALLRDALKPNLVQTLEHTPAIIHGGPFANIAHGCNSVIATKTALSLGEYTVTEAGFGADLGAEKFFDIKCRASGLRPDAVVIVATLKALKYNGGVPKEECGEKNTEALKRGLSNLRKHIENITQLFGLPAVVAINRFSADCEEETALVKEECAKLGVKAVSADVWAKGGEGGLELARELVELCERENSFRFAYDLKLPLREKIGEIAKLVYGADGALFTAGAEKQLERIEKSGFSELPVCMAKTQYSLSDDKEKRGRPSGFEITVRQLVVNAGAGFIVALTGDILKMPGLPKQPAAEKIDCDAEGKITGLF